MKIFAIQFWLGQDNINYCLQLSASDSFEKEVVVDSIAAMLRKAILYCVLFLVECKILIPIPSLFLAIIL